MVCFVGLSYELRSLDLSDLCFMLPKQDDYDVNFSCVTPDSELEIIGITKHHPEPLVRHLILCERQCQGNGEDTVKDLFSKHPTKNGKLQLNIGVSYGIRDSPLSSSAALFSKTVLVLCI